MSMKVSTSNRRLAGAAGVLAAGLLLAACGGGTSDGDAGSSGGSPKASQSGGQAVQTGETDVGEVLVDSKGMTLYAFAADSPGKSNCTTSTQPSRLTSSAKSTKESL